jgi:hypothetical protein
LTVTDAPDLAPLSLFKVDHGPGWYCLTLADDDMVAAMGTFEEFGYYGNGYGWAGVARSAVRAHAPEIAGRIEYDPEGGAFVARAEDPKPLARLGSLLKQALSDRDFLRQLLRDGEPEWFD